VTMFGAVGALTPPGGRFAELEKRTVALLEAAATGDYRPIFDAFNFEDGRPFTQVQANHTRFWKEWRDAYGEFQRIQLLGTGVVQGDPAVTVRLQFGRGSQILQYMWGPRRLAGWRDLPSAPVLLQAESARTWVYYNYRLPHLVRLRFGTDGGVTVEFVGPQ